MRQISFEVKASKRCGLCRHNSHKGYLTVTSIKEHDCLGKNCPYFVKMEHAYWRYRDRRKLEKIAFKNIERNSKTLILRDVIWQKIKAMSYDELEMYNEIYV